MNKTDNKKTLAAEQISQKPPSQVEQERIAKGTPRGKSVDAISGGSTKKGTTTTGLKASATPTKNGLAKERAKADEVFASSSSRWYAGAAFDRSPAAHTLPRPTQLLVRSPSRLTLPSTSPVKEDGDGSGDSKSRTRSASPTLLATSCPPSLSRTALTEYDLGGKGAAERTRRAKLREFQEAQTTRNSKNGASKTTKQAQEQPVSRTNLASLSLESEEINQSYEDLRTKSQALLAMLRAGSQSTTTTTTTIATNTSNTTVSNAPVASTKELEEMTLQVRRLLKLS